MKIVLVGVDFTEVSERALQAGHVLAQSLGARLHLIHVVEPIEDPQAADADTVAFHSELERKASEKLQEAAQPLGATYQVALGHRAETLLRLTDENDGLLVLGRPAPEAEATPFIGTSARALWMTNRPLLLVP